MPLVFILLTFLVINWISSYVFASFPVMLVQSFGSFFWTCMGILLLIIISWFFGD